MATTVLPGVAIVVHRFFNFTHAQFLQRALPPLHLQHTVFESNPDGAAPVEVSTTLFPSNIL